jgi:hypothetical protein
MLMKIFAPLNGLFYVISVFGKSRRNDARYTAFFYVHAFNFIVLSYCGSIVGNIRLGMYYDAVSNGVIFVLTSSSFSFFGRNARRAVGSLSDSELSSFLKDSLLYVSLQILSPLFFFAFKPIRCLIETDYNVVQCKEIINSQLYVSGYILVFAFSKMFISALPRDKGRYYVKWNLADVASMRLNGIQKIQGLLTIIIFVISMYLLTILLKEYDDHYEASHTRNVIIRFVGVTGCILSFIIFALEGMLFARFKKYKNKDLHETTSATATTASSSSLNHNPSGLITVTEISWVWVAPSIIASFAVYVGTLMFAITGDEVYDRVVNVFLILSWGMWVAAWMMKPRRTDRKYKLFLYAHFCLQFILPDINTAVGYARNGSFARVAMSFIRIAVTCAALPLAVGLRRISAQLSDADLTTYLTATVLRRNLETAIPLLFLSFEVVGCLSASSDQASCEKASFVSMFLSGFVLAQACMTLMIDAVPQVVRIKVGITVEKLARLELTKRRKVQTALSALTAMSAMFLFPFLGSEGGISESLYAVGCIGAVAAGLTLVIEIRVLSITNHKYESGRTLTTVDSPFTVARLFSSDKLDNDGIDGVF